MTATPWLAWLIVAGLACTRGERVQDRTGAIGSASPAGAPSTPARKPTTGKPTTMNQLYPFLDAVRVFQNDDGGDLFAPATLAQLAALPDVDAGLLAIASSPSEPLARRFAAVEALLQKGPGPVVATAATTAAVIDVVVQALPQDRVHNRWGLPGHAPGRLAKRLLRLPGIEAKADRLLPLLDDQRLLEIEGSESATIQDIRRYRIADLAAYLIALARKVAYPDDPDPAVRDRFIAKLRK
jgi:hypothetical protein